MFTELTHRLNTAAVRWWQAKKVACQAAWQRHLEADQEWLMETYGFDPFDKSEKFGPTSRRSPER
jgi:hypothetical protein